ncbi:VOC family protein [Pantoea sp. S18]|uniref:VOC family protein n=1 Tax=Pantoea sp. S18 TaxID=3019892 RepID=UPI0012AD5114|nr:VOC family protein [Pantoea sp. S18]MEA5101391.1 VOC family protein [Pantoea sp. S18]MRT44096.1 VOC family protein [Enterobacteriaceae bacterium RIT702]
MKIDLIDHIHVYVENIEQAEHWYNQVIGFSRDTSLNFWFEQGGPLVIKNNRAALSLFLRKHQYPGHTIAFAVGVPSFIELIPALNKNKIPFTVCDHDVSMSVYFSDLSNNKIEVTSYDYIQAKQLLNSLT